MTPKEKAEELVERFGRVIRFQDTYYSEEELYKMHKKDVKECALICVEQMIEACEGYIKGIKYWQEVKQEINNI